MRNEFIIINTAIVLMCNVVGMILLGLIILGANKFPLAAAMVDGGYIITNNGITMLFITLLLSTFTSIICAINVRLIANLFGSYKLSLELLDRITKEG